MSIRPGPARVGRVTLVGVPDAPDEPTGEVDQQALIDLLGPALDRCSALADRLAHLLIDPR